MNGCGAVSFIFYLSVRMDQLNVSQVMVYRWRDPSEFILRDASVADMNNRRNRKP